MESKLAVITGASSGIGLACAQRYAKGGYGVVLLARREGTLAQHAEKIRREFGVEALSFSVDVADKTSVENFCREQASLLARADVLVNNAGFAKGLNPMQEGDPDDWDAMFATNVLGLLRLTRRFLPHFLAKKSGHVVFLGSVASRWAYPRGNVYAATKKAVSSLTEGLRLDLLGTPVRVTEIAPGMVETEFSDVRFDGDKAKAKAVYAGMKPLSGADVAEAVFWATAQPPHVNVQEIVIYPTDQASTTATFRRS